MSYSITASDFKALLESSEITTHSEVSEVFPSEQSNHTDIVYGWIWNQLSISGLIILYRNIYAHPIGKPLSVQISNQVPKPWEVIHQNFSVIGEDGSTLTIEQIGEIILNETQVNEFNHNELIKNKDISFEDYSEDDLIQRAI